MPPKDKARQQQKEKIAEDKTFGLKNKNKSKVVQKYIKSLHSNAVGAPKGGKEDAERKERDQKAAQVQKAALMNSLFNLSTDRKGRAFDPEAKKAAKKAEEEAIAAGRKLKDEVKKEIIEGIANTIRLTNSKGIRMSELGAHPIIQALKDKHQDVFKNLSMLLFIKAHEKVFWLDDAESTNPSLRCTEDVEAEVAPDERPIEEIIEEKRAALPPGGTPVTAASFLAWKERREAERLAKVEEDRVANAKKAGASKSQALTGLSGRDLFTYDASLFVDDDGAASADEYDERSEAAEDEDKPADGAGSGEEDGEAEGGDGAGASAARGSGEDGGATGSGAGEDKGFSFKPGSRKAAEPWEPADDEEGAINAQLFLDEDDLPDDLDDLDDDDEAAKKG